MITKERNGIFSLQGKTAANDFANEKREKESGRLNFQLSAFLIQKNHKKLWTILSFCAKIETNAV